MSVPSVVWTPPRLNKAPSSTFYAARGLVCFVGDTLFSEREKGPVHTWSDRVVGEGNYQAIGVSDKGRGEHSQGYQASSVAVAPQAAEYLIPEAVWCQELVLGVAARDSNLQLCCGDKEHIPHPCVLLLITLSRIVTFCPLTT